MSVINKEKLIQWVNTWTNPIPPNIILSKISEQEVQEEELIDCPWCEGKGWIVEPDEANEPEQIPCQACDLHGRISSATIRNNWANEKKLTALERSADDDLPF